MSGSAARDGERPRTVEGATWIDTVDMADAPVWMDADQASAWVSGFDACRELHKARLAALGLEPSTVLDGKLVVLHPGQLVVEKREFKTGEHWLALRGGLPDICGPAKQGSGWNEWVVVASGSTKDAST